jgi:hypothetical protein
MTPLIAAPSLRFQARMAGLIALITTTSAFRHIRSRPACRIWRRRGYGAQHPGARAVISSGSCSRRHRASLHRLHALAVQLA